MKCPAIGVCYLPMTLMFGSVNGSLSMPVFVCDHLGSIIECIFGIDAGMNIRYVLNYAGGALWLKDYPGHNPLYCIPKLCTQDDGLYSRVMKQTVIKTRKFWHCRSGYQEVYATKRLEVTGVMHLC